MNRWVGKIAVVTGASSGIGAATVLKLAEQGLIVVGIARRADKIEELKNKLPSNNHKGTLYALKADMSDEKQIIEAFDWVKKTLGVVHILINNAGVAIGNNLYDTDTEIWRTIINVNLLGTAIATREVIKEMRKHDVEGHIVDINSIAGHKFTGIPMISMYTATKHGVTAMVEALRRELIDIKTKIKITSISPGAVLTPLLVDPAKNPELAKTMSSKPHLKPEDVADSIIYVLGTPPHVQIHELTIKPVGEEV